MRSTTVHILLTVLLGFGLVGCQAGPRWAWWKSDVTPADTSLVARSAAPQLPSLQSTPDPVTPPGMDLPPSSINTLAAAPPASPAVQAMAAPNVTIPTDSSPAIAAAPVAAYPDTGLPDGMATNLAPAAMPAVPTEKATTAPPPTVAQAAPYDPNGYQPPAAVETLPPAASMDRYASLGSDSFGSPAESQPEFTGSPGTEDRTPPVAGTGRYAATTPATPATPAVPSSTDRYGFSPSATVATATPPAGPATTAVEISTPPTATAAIPAMPTATDGQYALGSVDRYGPPTTPIVEETATAQEPPKTAAMQVPRPADTAATAKIALHTSPQVYRPAGTTSYASTVSVASLTKPHPNALPPTPLPSTGASPTIPSEPQSPYPATTTPASGYGRY